MVKKQKQNKNTSKRGKENKIVKEKKGTPSLMAHLTSNKAATEMKCKITHQEFIEPESWRTEQMHVAGKGMSGENKITDLAFKSS